ncbi:MAG: SRPBCC family protein [Rikenellaceae bacterium]|nr:SRPBCC family protein [Rikenellaceae bacterium]
MAEYKSKQVRINKPDEAIYAVLSDFGNFTPIVADKVEEWNATEETCSFKAKGFTVKLRMVEREPHKLIKITGDDIPFEFFFWIQLKSVAPDDTRMLLTLRAELNMMMKMMIGGKLQKGLDEMADKIAAAFNAV